MACWAKDVSLASECDSIEPLFGIEHESRSGFDEMALILFNPVMWIGANAALLVSFPQLSHHHVLSFTGSAAAIYAVFILAQNAQHSQFCMRSVLRKMQREKQTDPTLPFTINLKENKVTDTATGFWLAPGEDATVVETRSQAATVGMYEVNESLIDQVLFRPVGRSGLIPAWLNGGGQIHMDIESAFQNDAQLVRDFVAFYFNHSGFFFGAMSKKPMRVPMPSYLVEAVQRVLREFDAGAHSTVPELLQALYDAGLKKALAPLAIQFKFGRQGTFEFRTLRSQQSFGEMIAMMKLFRASLRYLKAHPGVVWAPHWRSRNPVTSDRDYRRMVQTVGLDWSDYRGFLSSWRKTLMDVADVVSSPQRKAKCDVLLEGI